jgi:glucose dehydrogenase
MRLALFLLSAACHAQDGTHYFPLDQIHRGNVAQLKQVWE